MALLLKSCFGCATSNVSMAALYPSTVSPSLPAVRSQSFFIGQRSSSTLGESRKVNLVANENASLKYFGIVTAIVSTAAFLLYNNHNEEEKELVVNVQPDGGFNVNCQVADRNKQIRIAKCESLKNELIDQLEQSSLSELKAIFDEKGSEFVSRMLFDDRNDPWANVNDSRWSILEYAMTKMKFNFDKEKIIFLIEYYISHSDEGQKTNLNPVHILVRNYESNNKVIKSLLDEMIKDRPEMLRQRLKFADTEHSLDLTPVELSIRKSYDEALMMKLVDALFHRFDVSAEERGKLIGHAEWLEGSGLYHTALIGKRMKKQITRLYNQQEEDKSIKAQYSDIFKGVNSCVECVELHNIAVSTLLERQKAQDECNFFASVDNHASICAGSHAGFLNGKVAIHLNEMESRHCLASNRIQEIRNQVLWSI